MPSGGDDPTRGWPTGSHSASGPQGQLEQVGKIADGLRSNSVGRRRAGFMLLWFILAVAALIAVVILLA